MKVKELLKNKGLEVIAIDNDSTVDTAVNKMIERNIGAVLVMDEGNFVGVFTERDVLKCWMDKNKVSFEKVKISEVMSRDIIVINPDDEVEYAMTIMTNKRIRHLPVVEQGKIIGLVSIRDVVKYHVGNLEAEVHYLKDFITGKYL